MKIQKGDRVQVLAGKDRGKTAPSPSPTPPTGKVIVDGVNVAKKHQKADRAPPCRAASSTRTCRCRSSNVAIVCPSCGKPTRVGYRFEPDGTKVRICRKCGGDIA